MYWSGTVWWVRGTVGEEQAAEKKGWVSAEQGGSLELERTTGTFPDTSEAGDVLCCSMLHSFKGKLRDEREMLYRHILQAA